MISTRGRYALRVLIDLAENQGDGYIPMKDVAARQGISLKYLEQIMPALKKNNIVKGVHGKGGGYRLAAEPCEINVGEVLKLTEGSLAPVACLAEGATKCDRARTCNTLDFWKGLNDVIDDYLRSKTLADLTSKASE